MAGGRTQGNRRAKTMKQYYVYIMASSYKINLFTLAAKRGKVTLFNPCFSIFYI
jgi:hypothetical protein